MSLYLKVQIDDLGQSLKGGADTATLLQPSIQRGSFTDDLNDLKDAELFTKEQVALLTEILESFSPDDSAANLSILYEMTVYQGKCQNFEFWQNYQDFDELGGSKLFR